MKKIFGICICLILLASALIVPTVAIAAETASDVTIHFLDPTAIATIDDKLFVADNIDDDNSAVHCFDVSGEEARWLYSKSFTEKIVNLSATVKNVDGSDINNLYVVYQTKIGEYEVSDVTLSEITTISNYTNPVDVTYGADLSSHNEYILTDSALYRKNSSGTANSAPITGTKSCIAIGEYIYYLYTENGIDVCKSYDGNDRSTPSLDSVTSDQAYLNSCKPSNSDYFLKNFHAKGLFVWNGEKVAIFNKSKICYINMGTTCYLSDVYDYQTQRNQDVVDVVANNDKLFVLNDNYQVDIYQNNNSNLTLIDTVGDDTVSQPVPTTFTSFTLAEPVGYPTNLVYKTIDGETSVDEIIKTASEYIILGYEGDETSSYYYVLVGNKFGWVQKGENASVDANGNIVDDRLKVKNTNVTRDPSVQYTTKFTSLNAVYLYELPRSDNSFRGETFQQTASKKPEVIVKQRFIETTAGGPVVWFYVTFEVDGQVKSGFVQQQYLGEFSMKVDESKLTVIEDRKINSTLFEAVKLYLYPDKELMTDDNVVTNENGIVKLYSGKRVTVISEEDGVAFIQIQGNNGSGNIYGYVDSSRLIGLHSITTNAIVGLSLLAAAIVLASVLIAIYFKRKKGISPRPKKDSAKD